MQPSYSLFPTPYSLLPPEAVRHDLWLLWRPPARKAREHGNRPAMQLPEWMRRRKEPSGPEGRPVLENLKTTVGNINRLPTLPEAATRAMAIAKDANCSLAKLSAVIERDPALAAGILKLANSALYRATCGAGSVRQAVVCLGLRECQNVILAVGMRSLFRTVPRGHQPRFEGLWRHSFLTGCLCRRLGTSLGLTFEGEEFAAGLSHDIGRVLIALGAPDHVEAADPLDFAEGPEALLREQAVLGTDHCYFGSWFANMNNLPAPLVSAVQFHHHPEAAQDHKPVVALVAVADHMANYVQREQRAEGYDATLNPAWAVLQPFVAPGRRLEELAEGIMEEAKQEAEDVSGNLAA
jgi:HD-like signal output (HDOD) protein